MKRIFLFLPNTLTGLRLVMAPLFAVLVAEGDYGEALAVFVLAGLSDAADGYLAKRFGLATELGRILDPIADKLLMLVSFLMLTAIGAAPVWLAALVIGRDIVIVFGALLAWALDLPLRIAPLPLGKISTALQIGYVALTLALLVVGVAEPQIANAVAVVTGAVTVASGLNYAALWFKALARAGSRAA